MKLRRVVAVAGAVVMSLGGTSACGSGDEESGNTEWLLVHTAPTASVTSSTSVTMSVSRDIFGFTDRPNRQHAYLDAGEYVSLWEDVGDDSFAGDPPNGVLTWRVDDTVAEAEVVILDATLTPGETAIEYTVSVEEGEIPIGDIAVVSLFVDSMAQQDRVMIRHATMDGSG